MLAAKLLAVMLELPVFYLDRGEDPTARRERLSELAEAIADASANRTEAAALLAAAWHESRFSKMVQEGRCDELPAGMRCDDGKARGNWQLHRAACTELWDRPVSEHARIGARCAMRLLRVFRRDCGTIPGAYGRFAGRACTWAGGEKRAATMRRLLARIS